MFLIRATINVDLHLRANGHPSRTYTLDKYLPAVKGILVADIRARSVRAAGARLGAPVKWLDRRKTQDRTIVVPTFVCPLTH